MRAGEIIRKYGIVPNKNLGQCFLIDKNILLKEVEVADLGPDDVVLEIGPGIGMLTEHLLDHCKKVVGIEKDPLMVGVLKDLFGEFIKEGKLEIIAGDALSTGFPAFDKCVSNIPYSISSGVVEKLARSHKPATLCLQKEFAERLVAKPGSSSYSRITVLAQFYFKPYYVHTVSRNCFFPSPKVDSAIVKLIPKPAPFVDTNCFFYMIKVLFAHKRKTVRNALVSERKRFNLTKEEARKAFDHVPYSSSKVFTLDLHSFIELFEHLQRLSFFKFQNQNTIDARAH